MFIFSLTTNFKSVKSKTDKGGLTVNPPKKKATRRGLLGVKNGFLLGSNRNCNDLSNGPGGQCDLMG